MIKYLDAKLAMKITAIMGAAGVGLGAFGAHGLSNLLERNDRIETWETATFYLLVHVVALMVLSVRKEFRPASWLCMAIGAAIFADSLYWLSLTQWTWLGAVTPLGGSLMIVGWLLVVFDK